MAARGSPARLFVPLLLAIAGIALPPAGDANVLKNETAGPNDGKRVQATRVFEAPVIDGRLDENVWSRAEPVTDFHQIRPVEYAQPSRLTEVWVLYDEDTLYIGARMHDERPDLITANILRQGQRITLSEDRFGVLISPFNDGKSGYAFYVNPNSVRDNAIFQETTFMRWEWDGIFQAAAGRDGHGWTAEMAIPLKTLSFDPRNSDWGISFQRSIAREREFIIRAMQARIGIVMSARLSWENFAQYDSVTDSIGTNSRLNWVPEAGQQVVLVANYSLAEDDITSRYRAAERDSALSVKYTFRF